MAFQRRKPAAIGVKAPFPGFVEPALASIEKVSPDERWIHEIKFDGYRVQVHLAPLIRKTQPYAKRVAHKGIWVEPKLLAEIEYRAKSAEGKVRHRS